ncbi:hypothetical protein SADUNF_Sadunf03G0132400 [Salix dunnii]|uniref:Molybdenum cofactor sulfurase n=1 Tax=Salix dunnii TaxID=1413687 RepID=A0A835N4N2_9ROSI|nr:hypothetical protein SADUNF_Sadunf03G0132400 [Salix dunnii]
MTLRRMWPCIPKDLPLQKQLFPGLAYSLLHLLVTSVDGSQSNIRCLCSMDLVGFHDLLISSGSGTALLVRSQAKKWGKLTTVSTINQDRFNYSGQVKAKVGEIKQVSDPQLLGGYIITAPTWPLIHSSILCEIAVVTGGRKAVGIMLTNVEQLVVNVDSKDVLERKLEDSPSDSVSNSPTQNSRPSSMVKAHTLIPAYLVAEAISTIRGLDLRWSGPITHSEMQYVRQYVFAKYPQYCNGIVVDGDSTFDLTNLCIDEESSKTTPDSKRGLSQSFGARESTPKFTRSLSDLDKTQLEASRLVDILNKKTSFQGNFMSIPEIQVQNRALKHCGLSESDYLVIFMSSYRDAMVMIGESYPFFRGNYYMTIIEEENDMIREFAAGKESKVIPLPETWLDLRIKGSHLSQYFRRKCKQIPKGLFSYPATVDETRYSLHWISEARRNSWHVLLDATGFVFGEHRLPLALHLPDFVLCTLDNTHAQPSKITCLLVRKSSFDTSASLD